MNCLIDTPEDVILLEKKKILKCSGSDYAETVSSLFNGTTKHAVFSDFFFDELCDEVNEYCNRKWPRYKVALRRDYFPNPWRIIAFAAATLLLILTTAQTAYSVLSYHNPK